MALLLAVCISLGCAASGARAAAPRPAFTVTPRSSLQPQAFRWATSDYVLRSCDAAGGIRLRVRGAKGWLTQVGGRRLRAGSYSRRLHFKAGQSTTVAFARRSGGSTQRFHLRCLPGDFPAYRFQRIRAGGPQFFIVQMGRGYAAIFSADGVPVWWYKASGEPDNAQLLPDGTIAFDPVNVISFQTGDYQVRSLTGRLIRTIRGGGGNPADIHEILRLANGNYLIGAQNQRQHLDTSAFGGASDATVVGIEIQEITPSGRVVRKWNSNDHINLAETGRWWHTPFLATQPYDVVHWNSVDVRGRFMLLSFRHLDAVYKVNRDTGRIVWKLGGTTTTKSLKVRDRQHPDHPLGGQHDARFGPDGTITIHDNRTGLGTPPRAVRYKIDEKRGTATLVHSITDPEVQSSFCCGSARLLPSNDWLVDWGGDRLTAAYDSAGRKLIKFTLGTGFSYRANPVADGALTLGELRRAMDAMARR